MTSSATERDVGAAALTGTPDTVLQSKHVGAAAAGTDERPKFEMNE